MFNNNTQNNQSTVSSQNVWGNGNCQSSTRSSRLRRTNCNLPEPMNHHLTEPMNHQFPTPQPRLTQHKYNRHSASNSATDWVYDDDVLNSNDQLESNPLPSPQMASQPQPPPPPPPEAFSNLFNSDTNTSPLVNSWSPGYEGNLSCVWDMATNWEDTINSCDDESASIPIPFKLVPNAPTTEEVETKSQSSESSYKGYEVVNESLFDKHYYEGTLETRKGYHDDKGKVSYITIADVFEYVTMGYVLADSYIDELTKHVTDNVPNFIMMTDMIHTTIHGVVYKRDIPVYSWEQYSNVALKCLEWAVSNPEKVALS